MQILYNVLVIPFLYVFFRIGALFNEKIRKGLTGRNRLLTKIKNDLSAVTRQRIWFHIASYGEFEQARPVLRLLKQERPDSFIVVSFFSPSGYDHIKAVPPVDYTCYLPLDTFCGARRFLAIVKPAIGIIVRHDIWPNLLWAMRRKHIPAVLMDASIPEGSARLWPIVRYFSRKLYDQFDRLLLISDDESRRMRLLVSDETKLIVTGDTKFDQVQKRALETARIDDLLNNAYLKSRKIFIVGSSWPSDEERIVPAFKTLRKEVAQALMIVVPHEPSAGRIASIETIAEASGFSSMRYSALTGKEQDYDILIVDKMGFLANIYRLGIAAFVGGSFTQKVHNVLEPAAHGIPVVVGPRINTQAEAIQLVRYGGAIMVESSQDLESQLLRLFKDEVYRNGIGERARSFVAGHLGASQRTVQMIQRYLSNPD